MKKKPGRPPYLREPSRTCCLILYQTQMTRVERLAQERRVSVSEVVRDALDLFLAVNMDIVHSGKSTISQEGTPS